MLLCHALVATWSDVFGVEFLGIDVAKQHVSPSNHAELLRIKKKEAKIEKKIKNKAYQQYEFTKVALSKSEINFHQIKTKEKSFLFLFLIQSVYGMVSKEKCISYISL